MNILVRGVAVFSLFGFLISPALAQQGRGRGFGGGLGMLLSNAGVQQELKLDATQVDKAKELAAKAREKFAAQRDTLQNLEGEERFKKMQEINREINGELHKSAQEFLRPEQLRRLRQIHFQVQGPQAFTDELIQSKLNLTDAQKSDIRSIVQTSNAEMRELFQSAQDDPDGTRAKIAEHRKGTLAKIESKLTDEQQTTWKEMLGRPFDMKVLSVDGPPPGSGGGR